MPRLLFPLVLFLAGCSSPPPPGPIVLGHLNRSQGEEEVRGIALALEAINGDSAKHITGRKVRIIHADAGSTPEEAQGQAVRLLAVDKVDGLLGPSHWRQIDKVALAAQSPLITVISFNGYAGSPAIAGLFPVGASAELRGRVLARYAKDTLNARPLLVLKEADAMIPSLVAKAFVDEFGSVVEHTLKANEIPGPVASKSGAVLLCGSAKAALAWRAKLPDIPILFAGDEADIAILQKELEPDKSIITVVSFHPADTTPACQEFVRLYREKHGNDPTIAAAMAFDAMNVWSEAARRANSVQGDKMREQFQRKDATFPVLTGELTFDDHRPKRPVILVRVEGAKIHFMERKE